MKKNKRTKRKFDPSAGFKERREKLMGRMNYDPLVNRSDLSKELAEISSHIYRIGVVKAAAEARMDTAKAKIEVVKAQVSKQIRQRLLEDGDKMTVPELEGEVMSHKKVKVVVQDHIDKKYDHNVCWAAFSSAQTKANQLTNLSMNYRKELDAGINSKVKQKRVTNKVRKKSKG